MAKNIVTTSRRTIRMSVCLATYNGQRYIGDQMRTILADISADDEIVVVDDASTDNTVAMIAAFCDPRIRIYVNSVNQGHVRAFERAIQSAIGSSVCLADQDDLWPRGRTDAIAQALRGSDIVVGQYKTFSDSGESYTSRLQSAGSAHAFRNVAGLAWGRREYFGCAMAFNSSIREYILPIPRYVEAHDHWIALYGNIGGELRHLDRIVVLRRLHDANLTSSRRRSIWAILRTRGILTRSTVHLLFRSFASRSRPRVSRDHPNHPSGREFRPAECCMTESFRGFPTATIIYPYVAHYRLGVFQELMNDSSVEYSFITGMRSRSHDIPIAFLSEIKPLRLVLNVWIGPFLLQPYVLTYALTSTSSASIFYGDVKHLSTWIAALVLRARGKRVYFWTIGWHRPEAGLKRMTRMIFYRLANGLLLYGETGRVIGLQMGYPPDRMHVIGNSHDSSRRDTGSVPGDPAQVNVKIWSGLNCSEIVGAVVRPNANKRLDLLVHAVHTLRQGGRDVGVLIVGEGPCVDSLRELALRLDVPASLPGAIYSPEELESVYRRLIISVVPEALGLTAIQSLWHGRPVITCDDVHRQMPEHESIRPGVTGDYYVTDDVADLALTIERWIVYSKSSECEIARKCRDEVARNWTATAHARRITETITRASGPIQRPDDKAHP